MDSTALSGGMNPFGLKDVPDQFNLAEFFLDRHEGAGRGNRIAVVCGTDSYTYAELADRSRRLAAGLVDLGIQSGDRVLFAMQDGPDFIAAWYAALRIGAVVCEVYTYLRPEDFVYYLTYTGAKAVITDAATVASIRTASSAPGISPILIVADGVPLSDGEVRLEEVASLPPLRAATATTRDQVALWKFTTGSTGVPKAAIHIQATPRISFELFAKNVLQLAADDVVLPVPKLFFGYARDMTALFAFGVGATAVVFPQRSTAQLILDLIGQYKPTVLVQVPTMVGAMLELPGLDRDALRSVRFSVSSGEALPTGLHERWRARAGSEILNGLGSSELYHIFISNRLGASKPGSIGQVVPGYVAELRGGEDDSADADSGELWIRGDTAALGYWQDPGKSEETFAGGWVRTGDVVRRDGDGYFWYVGRADSLIKVAGKWVAPLEVEGVLSQHPSVMESAVAGINHGGLTRHVAFVVVRPGYEPSKNLADQLLEFARTRLPSYKVPRELRFTQQLPRTASGKTDRRRLAE